MLLDLDEQVDAILMFVHMWRNHQWLTARLGRASKGNKHAYQQFQSLIKKEQLFSFLRVSNCFLPGTLNELTNKL